MYLRAFPRTPLVFMTDDAEVLKYALTHGTGLRRDGVGSPRHEQNWIGSKKYAAVQDMGEVWKHAPVVFEWYGDYAFLQSRKWSFDAGVDFMLNNHVSLINNNIGHVPPEAVPQLEKLARLAGYRFVLRELSHESTSKPGTVLNVKMTWANVGVAKLYQPYRLRLFLTDAEGKDAWIADSRADPRQWLPGEYHLAESAAVPANLKPGEYTLALALVDPDGQRPALKLAIDAPEHQGRYRVSRCKCE
jgi:hypothetical protein